MAARKQGLTIAVPTTGYMHHDFVTALAAVVGSGLVQAMNMVPRLPINQARQRIAETTNTEWLLFVDDDMVFTPDDVRRLLDTAGDIVSGLVVTRSKNPQPVVFSRNGDGYRFLGRNELPEATKEVDATTLAFTKVRMSVFDKLGTGFQFSDGKGEDIDFCRRAQDAGFKIVLNPRARVGHISQEVLYA